jgi:O-antigen/teichoic acid export membrane protein
VADAASEATRGSAIKLGAESLGRVAALATSLLIARGLGPEEFGVFAFLSGIAVLLAELGDLGLQGLASRALVAETVSLGAILRAKLWLTGFVLAASGAALGLLGAGLSAARGLLLVPLVLYYAFAGWSELFGVALRAAGLRGREAITILCFRLTTLALVCATLFLAARGLGSLAWALALSPAPAILIGGLFLRGARFGAAPAAAPLAVLKEAFPLAINGGLALLGLRVEVLALTFFAGELATGLFAAALKVVDSLILVPAAITAGAMPALTREAIKGQGPVRQRTAQTLALLGVPAALGLLLLAPQVVALLYGSAYAASAEPLRLLAPSLVPIFLNNVMLNALLALGKAPLLPRLTALRVGLAIVLALALVPRFGIAGAACGFSLSELLLTPVAAVACARQGFAVPVGRALGLAFAVSLPMAAALLIGRFGALTSIALGGAVYAATLYGVWRLAPRALLADVALAEQGRA